jgi:hypothetical protein
MATDRYTRIVLTLIAACLVYLCMREAAPPALAQSPQQPVQVVLVGVDRSSARAWHALSVAGIDGEPLKVNVTNQVRASVTGEVRTYVTNEVRVGGEVRTYVTNK